jgi:DNA-binding protein HU-beta
MRKSDLINQISEKTGIPKVDVLVTLETMFKEVKESLSNGQNIYIRGFGSFITKKRAAKIGRNIKKNIIGIKLRFTRKSRNHLWNSGDVESIYKLIVEIEEQQPIV